MDDGRALTSLPPRFAAWFEDRGWAPRDHQLAMVEKGRQGRHALLIAPTGGGKTLAGFLPSLIDLAERPRRNAGPSLHTLYLSPLKALAGDTGLSRRQRQRVKPPDMLLTTPEQLALFSAWEGARRYFEDLECVIVDEVHAIWPSKRGDLLSLGLARLQQFAPNLRRVGLSATVDDPDVIRRWLTPTDERAVDLVRGAPGAPPVVDVLLSEGMVPWAGHTARHAMPEVYE